MANPAPIRVGFVCAASCETTLSQYLLASPVFRDPTTLSVIKYGARSAAEVFNSALKEHPEVDWWVWVHQDVSLPFNWLDNFRLRIEEAVASWPSLAVAGAYGISTSGSRAGHVLDRGSLLQEMEPLPTLAQGLDELLVAVRSNSGLIMDPALGFDFYASDLALQAEQQGLAAVVLDIYCEHWSNTPTHPPYAQSFLDRLALSASAFEKKWQQRLPVITPCLPLTELGSAAKVLKHING